jgi:hypothetical protein
MSRPRIDPGSLLYMSTLAMSYLEHLHDSNIAPPSACVTRTYMNTHQLH